MATSACPVCGRPLAKAAVRARARAKLERLLAAEGKRHEESLRALHAKPGADPADPARHNAPAPERPAAEEAVALPDQIAEYL